MHDCDLHRSCSCVLLWHQVCIIPGQAMLVLTCKHAVIAGWQSGDLQWLLHRPLKGQAPHGRPGGKSCGHHSWQKQSEEGTGLCLCWFLCFAVMLMLVWWCSALMRTAPGVKMVCMLNSCSVVHSFDRCWRDSQFVACVCMHTCMLTHTHIHTRACTYSHRTLSLSLSLSAQGKV